LSTAKGGMVMNTMFNYCSVLSPYYWLGYYLKILYNTFQMLENTLLLIRTKKNLTQEELAKAVEVTRQTIIAIEKGNYTPSVLLALRIAKFFNVKVEDIFTI